MQAFCQAQQRLIEARKAFCWVCGALYNLFSWHWCCSVPKRPRFGLQADKYGVPRICFVNKMDRMGADFFNTVKMIVSNLAASPCVLQVLQGQSMCIGATATLP